MKTHSWRSFIAGEPVGKGRPRFARATGRAYTPAKTRTWEKKAEVVLRDDWDRPALEVPARLLVVALFPRPQRIVWKTRPMVRVPHAARPDSDNIAKAVGDAVEKAGIVKNDSTFFRLDVRKFYAGGDELPGVHVHLIWKEAA
jgi:Holliday junction resolvase RusA-like endonuclease